MGDTHYLEIKDRNHYVESVDEDGKVGWKLIEAVTKHLPINRDGTSTLLKVTLKNGKTARATKAKSFLTKVDNKIVPIRGDELTIGTLIPVKVDQKNNITDTNLNDVYMEEIVHIDEVQPSSKYVYDLTVQDTKTFCLLNGLCMMDSFHHSGIASISTTTQGVPRIKELLSLTKNLKTPQMIIYLTKEYMGSRDMANKIASYIKFTTLGHIRGRLTVYYDPDPYRKGGFMENDNVTKVFTSKSTSKYSCQADVAALPWLMRIEFNRESLFEKEVTLLDIKSKFCNLWERRHSDKSIKKEEKYVLEKVTQIAVLSNTDFDKVPLVHIRFDMVDFDMSTLNDFIDHIIDKFKLKGISSIANISAINEERVLTFDNESKDIEKKKQYVIYTMGTNLYDIRYLNGIDINKTICNDVIAMYETFGIEAARATLLREIIYAYELAGSSVNYHHVSVLIDLMTFNGYMTSVDRHGMNKSDVGPLSRASFEKTVDQLQTAAIFGEIDYMNGVSSRIMAGLVIKGGTGLCNVILDTDMIQNSEFTEDIGQKYVKTYNDITGSNFMSDIISKPTEENEMFIPV
jgi:DNA-directed RNA polymerase beta' subunit